MRFLVAIIEALVGIIQRNPLTVIIVVILAIVAPALLKGIAMFVLYFFLGLIVLALLVMFLFRWRLAKAARQMNEQFGQGGPQAGPRGGFGGFSGFGGFGPRPTPEQQQEGEMKVYTTSETPEKRISKNVGDYVEFEEEKNL